MIVQYMPPLETLWSQLFPSLPVPRMVPHSKCLRHVIPMQTTTAPPLRSGGARPSHSLGLVLRYDDQRNHHAPVGAVRHTAKSASLIVLWGDGVGTTSSQDVILLAQVLTETMDGPLPGVKLVDDEVFDAEDAKHFTPQLRYIANFAGPHFARATRRLARCLLRESTTMGALYALATPVTAADPTCSDIECADALLPHLQWRYGPGGDLLGVLPGATTVQSGETAPARVRVRHDPNASAETTYTAGSVPPVGAVYGPTVVSTLRRLRDRAESSARLLAEMSQALTSVTAGSALLGMPAPEDLPHIAYSESSAYYADDANIFQEDSRCPCC